MALGPLDTSLSQLVGWWLVASCCGATICVPCPMLVRHGTPRRAAGRFRCQRCGGRRARVVLTDRADSGGVGGPLAAVRIEVPAADD